MSSSVLLHTHVPYTHKTYHLIHPCSRQNMFLIYRKTPGGTFKDPTSETSHAMVLRSPLVTTLLRGKFNREAHGSPRHWFYNGCVLSAKHSWVQSSPAEVHGTGYGLHSSMSHKD